MANPAGPLTYWIIRRTPEERKYPQDRMNICRISPLKCHFHHPGNFYAHYTFVLNLKSIVITLQYFQAMEVLSPNTEEAFDF